MRGDTEKLCEMYHITESMVRVMTVLREHEYNTTEVRKMEGAPGIPHHSTIHAHKRIIYSQVRIRNDDHFYKFMDWVVTGCRPDFPEDMYNVDLTTCPVEFGGCGEHKRITSFPVFPIDLRCSTCISGKVLPVDKLDVAARCQKTIKRMLEAVHKERGSVPHLEDLISGVVDGKGGMEGLVRAWVRHLEIAEQQSPGSKYVLDHYDKLAMLIGRINQDKESSFEVGDMSEEQTKEYITHIVMERLKAQKEDELIGLLADETNIDGAIDLPADTLIENRE